MEKRNYTHVQALPPESKAMPAEGKTQRKHSFRAYGYRRMWLWLKRQNIFCNPKTVLRIMKKYDLLSEIRRRRKWRQMGQQVYKYKNLLNRNFHAAKPNNKWVSARSFG